MEQTPKVGEIYRHYRNGLYQILTVARHSQTRDKYVVYQALQGDFRTYVEPLALFTKEISHEKYPDVQQDYRFEWVDRDQLLPRRMPQRADSPSGREIPAETGAPTEYSESGQEEAVPLLQKAAGHISARQDAKQHTPQARPARQTSSSEMETEYAQRRQRQLEEREHRREQFKKPAHKESASDELRANPSLIRFLDTETYEEKYQVLSEIRDDMTDRLIDDIAVVLDVVIPEGNLSERYAQLKNIILTRQRFEQTRFR